MSSDASGESSISRDDVLAFAKDWYHVGALALAIVFMLAVRVQAWQRFVRNGEVYFSGNDPWYHFRQVMYTVNHYPQIMPFDPWTGFPTGKTVGQFGTLFDQIVATAALVVGLGSPSQHTVAMTLLFEPAVAGALTAIPVYFIGKRLGGRLGGVVAAVTLALLPGLFLSRSLVGVADHNGTEPLFQAFAVLATMVALAAAQRDYPVYEQVVDREWGALRDVAGWSVLAGVATGLYLWVWPPGVLIVGIFAAFYTVVMCGEYFRGRSPDHVAFVGVISMLATFVMALVPLSEGGFAAAAPSLLQPVLALLTAVGVAFLAWFAREWDERSVEREYYPVAVVGLIIVAAAVAAVLLPTVFDKLVNQLVRFVGFTTGAATRTVGEAQPFLAGAGTGAGQKFAAISQQYGATFYTALLAAAVLIYEPLVRSDDVNELYYAVASVVAIALVFLFPNVIVPGIAGVLGVDATFLGILIVGGLLFAAIGLTERSAGEKLLLIYGLFIVSAAFTQVRFNYYLVIPVVALNGYLVSWIWGLLNSDEAASAARGIRGDQVIAVAVVLLVLFVPLAAPISAWTADDPHVTQAGLSGDRNGPGAVVAWDSMLEWMNESTPAEGDYNGTGTADQLDYYGTYSKTDDYQYPDGAYGVMSWWDYGHWITAEGKRIPVANPFQQHAKTAADFLLAPNESAANDVLNRLGSGGEKTKYVAVDWKMVTTQGRNAKFFAPTIFTSRNVSQYDYYQQLYQFSEGSSQNLGTVHNQKYYESLVVRLYRYQGSAVQPSPVVVDWDQTIRTSSGEPVYRIYTKDGQNDTVYKQFSGRNAMQNARNFVQNDTVDRAGEPTSQVGGVGKYPAEFIPALEHYRMVGTSTQYAPARQIIQGERFQNIPTWAKLYERVPGATVQGTGPANATVRATVQMDATRIGPNATFTYTQYAQTGPDGEFTMTVPYSTTGYANFGPENGHTNVSVRATGPYHFTTGRMITMQDGSLGFAEYTANVSVSEAKVIGEDTSPVTVTLTNAMASDSPSDSTSDSSNSTSNTTASMSEPAALETTPTLARAT